MSWLTRHQTLVAGGDDIVVATGEALVGRHHVRAEAGKEGPGTVCECDRPLTGIEGGGSWVLGGLSAHSLCSAGAAELVRASCPNRWGARR